ncbi:steroid transmembrane transporter SLC22A24-like isoform X5 [Ornithorhynchus anatinus]|uniref:steroid transmembrane transporter SLC22A24-like isoform X5 n=1 Tax=Ornithorhynchus anatinus TaxID=9258 RepID=UPI0004541ED8|nr:steroid transmembrane transporter SLC22A24-like isoform X5 [Ornithorhynchus anatinus]
MGFDDLLDQVGGVGKFQVIQLVFLAIPICFTTPQLLLENFSGAIPAHRCRIPLLDNHTGSSGVLGNLSTEALLRVSIPLDQNQKLEKCHRFSQTQWPLLTENGTGPQPHEPATEPCEDGWVYDRSVFTSTFVTEWDLVCELLPQKAMSQSIYMAGILLGSIIYGHISDRFGRKSVLIWAYLQLGMASTGVAFSPTLTIYRLLRFLSAFALAGIMINTGSLILEWTPTVSRAFFMMMFVACYSVGHLVLAGFAYAIRDWRSLQVAVSVPFFAIFLYSWGYAESARWLSMAGRPGQALKELRKVARINRKAVAKGCLTIEMLRSLSQDELTAAKSHYTVIDLFRLPALRRISCCITLASQTSSGLDHVSRRIGGILAPLWRIMGGHFSLLPTIFYGAIPITAGIAVLFLPETQNRPLPDTIQDVEGWKSSRQQRLQDPKQEDFSDKITQF